MYLEYKRKIKYFLIDNLIKKTSLVELLDATERVNFSSCEQSSIILESKLLKQII